MNWPPEKTIKYEIKSKDELEKDYIEIPLVDGAKSKGKAKNETERS